MHYQCDSVGRHLQSKTRETGVVLSLRVWEGRGGAAAADPGVAGELGAALPRPWAPGSL